MNKLDLVNAVFERTDVLKKECEKVVDSLFEIMIEELSKGNSILVTGFGTFEIKDTKSKEIIDLKTKAKISIPSQKAIKFRLAKKAKEKINR